MSYIAGTGVPSAVTSTCPRCKTLRRFTSTGPELSSYICNGCEWLFTFGAGSSPLTTNGATTTASTALSFASGGTVFLNGQTLFVNDGASSEIVIVSGTSSATVVPVSDFDFSHNSGVAVSLALATPALALDVVPAAPPWGF